MVVTAFVLGRPGSGKTTVVQHILDSAQREKISTQRMKDYNILYNMFMEEEKNGRMPKKFRRAEAKERHYAECSGFDVLDLAVFDTALEILEEQVVEESRKSLTKKLVTIEFARDDYQVALSRFSPKFLQESYFFFLDASVPVCMKRIYHRITNPPTEDHHFVSEYIMDRYYSLDTWSYMSQGFQEEYGLDSERVVAYRNIGSLEDLHNKTSEFTEMIFSREFATSHARAMRV